MAGSSRRRVRVVVSDFHLGEGRRLPDGSINELEDFSYDRQFAEFVEYHRSGSFVDAEVELVLNGDFFNLLDGELEDPHPALITSRKALRKTKGMVEGHPELFDALERFARSDRRRVVFIMGNHDPQILFPAVQEYLRELVGERTAFHLENYQSDGVYIEHGSQFDPSNAINMKRPLLPTSSGESVINLPIGSVWVVDYLTHLKRRRPYCNKVQPFGAYMRWAFFNDFRIWWWAVGTLIWWIIKSLFRKPPMRLRPWKVFNSTRGFTFYGTLERAAQKVFNANEGIHTVIFGHTHVYLHRQMGPDQEYLNTGTWDTITHLSLPYLGQVRHLTYVHIEQDDERPRAELKSWVGKYHVVEQPPV